MSNVQIPIPVQSGTMMDWNSVALVISAQCSCMFEEFQLYFVDVVTVVYSPLKSRHENMIKCEFGQ